MEWGTGCTYFGDCKKSKKNQNNVLNETLTTLTNFLNLFLPK